MDKTFDQLLAESIERDMVGELSGTVSNTTDEVSVLTIEVLEEAISKIRSLPPIPDMNFSSFCETLRNNFPDAKNRSKRQEKKLIKKRGQRYEPAAFKFTDPLTNKETVFMHDSFKDLF